MQRLHRCGNCGRKAVGNDRCEACGHQREQSSGASTLIRSSDIAPPLSGGGTPPALRTQPTRSIALKGVDPVSSAVAGRPNSGRNDRVEGRVVIVQQRIVEPPDPDLWKWVAIPAWGLVLFLSPVLAALAAAMWSGVIVGLVVFVGVALVLRFVFSNRLYESWQFVAALRGRHVVEPVPLVHFRIRAASRREIQVRMKGHTSSGAIVEGDRVVADGRWDNGVFRVRTVACQRTGAITRPRQPNAFGLAVSGSAVLVGAAVWLVAIGMPWAGWKARSFAQPAEQAEIVRRMHAPARSFR